MIQEVDAALEALVRRDALNGSRVEVVFDAPTKDWAARRNAPTVNLYLYDIREDLSRREVSPQPFRENGSPFVKEHRLPPRRFRLQYLITAWTQRPEDEHRLLAGCLATLVRNESMPEDLVTGSLKDLPYPVILNVALPLPPERSIADVWTALGGELKPSLDLTVIAALDAGWRAPAAAPVLEGPVIGVGGPGIDGEERRGGRRRTRHGKALQPVESAVQAEVVQRGETGVRTQRTGVGPGGRAEEPPAGEVQAAPTGKGASKRRGEAAPDGAPEAGPDLQELAKGRVVRVRGISRP